MTPDQTRLMQQAARPAIAALWKALKPLTSVVTVLQTGAHPDDETSQMLARFTLADGARVAYACAVRGEGGQNNLGTEARSVLGVLRTGEMAKAAETLDIALYWLNEDYDGAINDFGFSKSGPETLARWGHDRLVERLVRVIREEQPDIVTPTFLDVPGQHGHHRAVTQATEEAFLKAGDPTAYPDHISDGLAPWSAAKYYLPAWSGAGMAYDDDEPPPATTVTVDTGQFDPVLGATYAQIGQWSRAYHQSQGMGRWIDEGPAAIPLHRKYGPQHIPADEQHPFDGLPHRLGDLGTAINTATAATLSEADAAIDSALEAFPAGPAVADALVSLISALDRAIAGLPADARAVRHRVTTKRRQAERALMLALGLIVRLEGPRTPVAAGDSVTLKLTVFAGLTSDVAIQRAGITHPDGWNCVTETGLAAGPLPQGQPMAAVFHLHVPADAAPTSAYRFCHDPLSPQAPVSGWLSLMVGGQPITVTLVGEPEVAIIPAVSVALSPNGIVSTGSQAPEDVTLTARNNRTQTVSATISLPVPAGWAVTPATHEVTLAPSSAQSLPFTLTPGLAATDGAARTVLVPKVTLSGADIAGHQVRWIHHPHIAPLSMVTEAGLPFLTVALALDRTIRIGVVEGGSDQVSVWLERLGLPVTRLDANDLATGDLSQHDTILIGIFAYGARPDLRAANDRVQAWVRAGGNLVTLYHRPWDAWDPDSTPPLRLEIGQPSLRWRVTDERAAVTALAPDHPLLTTPNRIGPADWTGWVKERGLYFAKSWDQAYIPLVSMADPGEEPLIGSLLSAAVGQGRHTHCCLVLHTQLDGLVAGGFRLLANLITPDTKR